MSDGAIGTPALRHNTQFIALHSFMVSTSPPIEDQLQRVIDWLRYASSQLAKHPVFFGHGTDNSMDEAAALVLGALDLPPDVAAPYLDGVLVAEERDHLATLLQRRIQDRVPVPYLLGWCWYAGYQFAVNEEVLIPRSPLFELIDQRCHPWLASEPSRILDLCTGSGCLAILLALAFPEAQVDASDLSAAALEVARVNRDKFGLQEQLRLLQGDGLQACAEQRYDLILTNPPYVATAEHQSLPAEYTHEPAMALESGADGLDFVRQLLRQAPRHLNPQGVLICEVGSATSALIQEFPQLPFNWLEFDVGGDGVFVLTREELLLLDEE